MDFSEFDINKFISKVSAQSLDGLLQPTFGDLDLGDDTGVLSSISLTADSTSIGVGETFTVDVELKTNDVEIKEFHIIIDYDTSKLSVIDDQPTTGGTQIEFLDTVFEVEDGDNLVDTSTGRITLIAKTATSTAYQVNRDVARIKFQSQKIGTSVIEPVSGTSGSQLINENDVAVAVTLNSITISASTETSSSSSSSSSSTSSSSSSSSSSGGVDEIPDTGLAEDIAANMPFLIGLLLIALGVMLRRARKDREEEII